MEDLIEYGKKLDEMNDVKLLYERYKLKQELTTMPLKSLFTFEVTEFDVLASEDMQTRLTLRTKLADLSKKVSEIIKNQNGSYADCWYYLSGHFVANSSRFYNSDVEFRHYYNFTSGFPNSLNTKSLTEYIHYLNDFVNYTSGKHKMSIKDASKTACADLRERGFYPSSNKFDLTLPDNWEKYYSHLQKIELVNKKIDSIDKDFSDAKYVEMLIEYIGKHKKQNKKSINVEAEEINKNHEDKNPNINLIEDKKGNTHFNF